MLWLFSFLLELVLVNGIVFNGRFKRFLVWFFMVYIIGVSILQIGEVPNLAAPILILLPFRLLNIARIAKERMHPVYLRRMTLRTSIWLMGLQAAAVLLTLPQLDWIWPLLPFAMLGISIVLLSLLVFHLHKTRHVTNTN